MKTKKSIIALCLVAVLAFSVFALCACGAAETPAAEPTAAPAAGDLAPETPAETEAAAELSVED